METHPEPPKRGTRRDALFFKYYNLYRYHALVAIKDASEIAVEIKKVE